MSFRGRGNIPSLNMPQGGPHYGPYRYLRCYVPLDNTYVIMQMIATFILLICGVLSYISFYKSSIIDPIQSSKTSFINSYILVIFLLLCTTLLINLISKSKLALLRRLVITLLISIITMITFFTIKLNMDNTYNYEKFSQISNELEIGKDSNANKISIGLNGMKLKNEQEYYIDECVKLYSIFKIKTYGIVFMHLLLNILLGYQISKVSNIEEKKEKLNKDDEILFDEDQGII